MTIRPPLALLAMFLALGSPMAGADESPKTGRVDLKGGAIRQATFLAESGAQMVTRAAKFIAFDHLPGGFVFVPKETAIDATSWKTVRVEGFANALAR